MKYTESEVLKIAEKVLSDLNPEFFEKDTIKNCRFSKEEELIRGKNKGLRKSCWVISITVPVFDSMKFLTISDDDGEPLYIQNSQAVMEIEKSRDGKYIRKQ